MSAFDPQEKLSRELLSKPGIYIIHKATRAGATVTSVKVALDMGLKVVLIVPNKKIGEELIATITNLLGYSPNAILIKSNPEMCQKVEKNEMIFQYRGDCRECAFNDPDKCDFQNLMIGNFDLTILTYHKLTALLSNSESKAATNILQKLTLANVVIFDEFSAATLPKIQTIDIVTKDKDGNVCRLHEQLVTVLSEGKPWQIGLLGFIQKFAAMKRSAVYENAAIEQLCRDKESEKRVFNDGWRDITNLHDLGVKTRDLELAFIAMFARKVVITAKDGNVWLTLTVEDALWHIKKLVSLLGSEKHILVVDAYEPSVNFDSLFGKVEHRLWGPNGDPLSTNDKQLVIHDSAHWGASDFSKDVVLQAKYQSIIKRIIALFSAQRVLIVTLNEKMANAVQQWGLPKETMITWYRSGWMRGVQAKGRDVMILLNGPYIPRRAYDASAKSFKIEDFISEMDGLEADHEKEVNLPYLLWLDSLRGEFINAIGRVKDPKGLQRSAVFGLGMRKGAIKGLLKDNCPSQLSKPHLTGTCFNGAMIDEGLLIAQLWLNGVEANETELPIIARIISETQQKKSVHASYIIIGQTSKVKIVALKYQDLLEHYGVLVIRKTGGVEFRLAQS